MASSFASIPLTERFEGQIEGHRTLHCKLKHEIIQLFIRSVGQGLVGGAGDGVVGGGVGVGEKEREEERVGVAQIVVNSTLAVPTVVGGGIISEVVARGCPSTQTIGGKPLKWSPDPISPIMMPSQLS